MRKLHAQHGRLKFIQTAVYSDFLMFILGRAAVRAEASQTCREIVVVGGNDAAVASAAEVLRRIKTETANHAHRTRAPSVVSGANRLRGVFDHGNATLFAEVEDWIHRRALSG